MAANFETVGTLNNDALIAGNAHLLVGVKITVLSGQVQPRGAVMGKITTGGKYILSLSAATDGIEPPDLI